jgi:hypothetical protein
VIILFDTVQAAEHAVFGDYFNEIIKLVGVRWTVDASRIQSRERGVYNDFIWKPRSIFVRTRVTIILLTF